MTDRVDCVVIGGGVVGLAVARALAMRHREVLVLESSSGVGRGISSRNSGVVHAGLYNPRESLKTKLCVKGRQQLYDYALEHSVPHKVCGKLVVAESTDEEKVLKNLFDYALANGVRDVKIMDRSEFQSLEHELQGTLALWSPCSGIIDVAALIFALQADIEARGGLVVCMAPIEGGEITPSGIQLRVGGKDPMDLLAGIVVNSAGLDAHTIAMGLTNFATDTIPAVRYASGHYYSLSRPSPFSHLIYPIPEPGGLGIHLTLDMGGQARFGPDVRWIEHPSYQFDDSQRDRFAQAIRRYYPALDNDLLSADYVGVRPKLSTNSAEFADFRIDGPAKHGTPGLVNLFGIESPGLTACLALADYVAEIATAGG